MWIYHVVDTEPSALQARDTECVTSCVQRHRFSHLNKTMGKKSSAARRSGATTSTPEDDATKLPNYGLEQFRGEGPLFWIRQFAGLLIVVLGALILASAYFEDASWLPVSPEYRPYLALAVIVAGAIVHEFRPWKVCA
jgi:hypothetical protein